MRHGAQCVGRVLRGKTDWGLMVFADKRFARADKRNKLPKWIMAEVTEAGVNLSTDMAVSMAKSFFRVMSQPLEHDSMGVSLWNENEILRRQMLQRTFDRQMRQVVSDQL